MRKPRANPARNNISVRNGESSTASGCCSGEEYLKSHVSVCGHRVKECPSQSVSLLFWKQENPSEGDTDVKGPFNIIEIISKKPRMQEINQNTRSFVQIDQSEFSESGGNRKLGNKEIEELYQSYNSMKQFVEALPRQQSTSLTQILDNYAEKPTKLELHPINVMHILDKRIQRMLKNRKLKKNWNSQDEGILCWTYCHYCHLKGIKSVEETTMQDWEEIARLIPGANPHSCMFKILGFRKIKLAQQKWSDYENELLLQITSKFEKKNWRIIAEQLYNSNQKDSKIFRNGKQCKEHWVCYLNPALKKGSWTLQEDKKLVQFVYLNNGSRKWAEIARIFGGRTENSLKNRYNLIIDKLRKEKSISHSSKDIELLGEYLDKLEMLENDESERRVGPQKVISHKSAMRRALTDDNSFFPIVENDIKLEGRVDLVGELKPIQMFPILTLPTSIGMGIEAVCGFPVQYPTNQLFIYYQPNRFGHV